MGKGARVTWPLAWVAWLYGSVAMACDFCRPQVQAGIFNERFIGRLALILMPLAVVLLLVALIVWTTGRAWSR